MAISIDTVYQMVLVLANKEQRGYITPQEFNLLANQAQMTIFESYFYSKNLRVRKEPDRSSEIDETDIDELLGAKLAPFKLIQVVTDGNTFLPTATIEGVARDVFQTGRVFVGDEVCHKLPINEVSRILRSQRHLVGTTYLPIYCDSTTIGDDIEVYAGSATALSGTSVNAEYFVMPRDANWGYVVVNSKALFNANTAINFELHPSETDTLITGILALAGIIIKDPTLTQLATQVGAGEQQLQNQ